MINKNYLVEKFIRLYLILIVFQIMIIINEKGEESVVCNHSDGLAIELLNNLKKK